MKIDNVDDLKFYEKAMQIALKMQECLNEDDNPALVGVAAQKIASFCAHKVGLSMELYLEACAYSYQGTNMEMERHKNDK